MKKKDLPGLFENTIKPKLANLETKRKNYVIGFWLLFVLSLIIFSIIYFNILGAGIWGAASGLVASVILLGGVGYCLWKIYPRFLYGKQSKQYVELLTAEMVKAYYPNVDYLLTCERIPNYMFGARFFKPSIIRDFCLPKNIEQFGYFLFDIKGKPVEWGAFRIYACQRYAGKHRTYSTFLDGLFCVAHVKNNPAGTTLITRKKHTGKNAYQRFVRAQKARDTKGLQFFTVHEQKRSSDWLLSSSSPELARESLLTECLEQLEKLKRERGVEADLSWIGDKLYLMLDYHRQAKCWFTNIHLFKSYYAAESINDCMQEVDLMKDWNTFFEGSGLIQ